MQRLPHDPIKVAAVQSTAAYFKVTDTYVRRAVSGGATYGRCADIKKHYQNLYKKIASITKN